MREGSIQLVEGPAGDSAWLDIAASHALLRRIAERELPATVRVYRPHPTVAFGRLDALRDGFAAAAAAAARHGFEPALRNAGGHAAAYTGQAVVYEELTPHDGVAIDVRARFEPFSERIARALRGLGVDARVGEIPGEYCPGAFSVNAGGTTKLAGVAQRVMRGAALTAAVLVVGDGPRVRGVLRDVYASLGLAFDERTVGTLADAGAADASAAGAAIVAEHAREASLTPAALDERTLALARELGPRHRLA